MDYSQITIAAAAITAAKEIGRAALGIRDFNQFGAAMSQINDQLLKAQDSLFSHNTQLMALQQENFELREELRKLKEAQEERGRYTLFALSDRFHALRVNLPADGENLNEERSLEPLHYVCQPCFSKGIKAVLHVGPYTAVCPVCKIAGVIKDRPIQQPIKRSTSWI